MPDRNIQKILVKPPLGGLNIHDNPLDLNFMFATELTNFMPPTTKLEVRPGIENMMSLGGMPMGMFSYSVGARKVYSSGLLIVSPGIETPKYSSILIRLLNADGSMAFYSINPEDKSQVWLGNYKCDKYGSEYTMMNNSMFFTDGSNNSTPYIYSGTRGVCQMMWHGPTGTPEASKNLTDLDNVTAYNTFLFANQADSLNIYYMAKRDADPEATDTTAWLHRVFCPSAVGSWNLTGIIKRGGSIVKMFTLGANTHDNIQSYFCVLTDQGELVLYQGTTPGDLEKWKMVGLFEIPIPLNKRCLCKVEGDVIIATQNGMVSLHRLMFGAKTQVTEALEWRLSELFTRYEFRMNAYKDHFFLKYFRKNRWLIFNVPEFVPVFLKDILRGYIFKKGRFIVFNADVLETLDFKQQVYNFITNYILLRQVNYGIRYTFNGDVVPLGESPLGICIDFSCSFPDLDDALATDSIRIEILVKFYITTLVNGKRTTHHFLVTPSSDPSHDEPEIGWLYACNFMSELSTNLEEIRVGTEWNATKIDEYEGPNNEDVCYYFAFEDEEEYEVTDIRPYSSYWGISTDPDIIVKDALRGTRPAGRYEVFVAADNPGTIDAFLVKGRRPYGGAVKMPVLKKILADYFSQEWIERNDAWPHRLIAEIAKMAGEHVIIRSDIGGGPYATLKKFVTFNGYNKTIFRTSDDPDVSATTKTLDLTVDGNIDITNIFSGIAVNRDIFAGYRYTVTVVASFDGEVFIQATLTSDIHANAHNSNLFNWQYKGRTYPKWDVFLNVAQDKTYLGSATFYYLYDGNSGWIVDSSVDYDDMIDNHYYGSFTSSSNMLSTLVRDYLDTVVGFPSRGEKGEKASDKYLRSLGWIENYTMGSANRYDNDFKETTNYDFSLVPFFNQANIAGPYESSQYVFDTHYGTWARWENINMVDAVEHNLDFYFVRTDPNSWLKPDRGPDSRTMLCRFNLDYNGDFQDSDTGIAVPIKASYKAGHTDIGIQQAKKQIKRVKIYGTSPVFWGSRREVKPFIFDYEIDFKPQTAVEYPYYYYSISPVAEEFKKKFGYIKPYKEMNYVERKRYNKIYALLAERVKDIELPLMCNPCDRISLGCKLTVLEHNLIIYGYELYYELVNP
jgi:hypothetical protein